MFSLPENGDKALLLLLSVLSPITSFRVVIVGIIDVDKNEQREEKEEASMDVVVRVTLALRGLNV